MKLESFNTILSDCTSKYNKIKKEDYLPEGQFPIIDQGQKFIGGYTDDGGLITDIEKELIIFGDHTKILKFIDFPIAIGADGVKVLHVNKEKADPRYIYYFLKSVKLTDAGYSRHFKFLKEIKIPVPENIDDQIKIARILNHVETLITQRKESIELLDELVKSKFLEMFGDPVKNEKKWDIDLFKKIAKIDRSSISPSEIKEHDYYIGLEDIEKNTGVINKTSTENANELKSSKFKFTPNHILYAKLRPNLNKVALPNRDGICSTDIFPILPIEGLFDKSFLCFLMRSNYFVNEMTSKSSGANLPRANTSSIENLKVYLPPKELRIQFDGIVKNVESLKIQYITSLKELENMFGALSQKVFSLDLDEVKKKSEEVMEDDSLEQYSNNIKLRNEKRDISKMTLLEYLEIPYELVKDNEKWEFNFIGLDVFYQFLLLEVFKERTFTFEDIVDLYSDYFYFKGDMDFDNEKWKQIIFKFLEANPPLLEQIFDQDDKIIKLKLTDEAFKA